MAANKRVAEALASLNKMSTKKVRDGMSRFGIPNGRAIGVPVGEMRKLAKQLGCDHELAEALWHEEFYEARMLATMVADPRRVTPKLMDAWCRDFDNWALCDTACFSLWHLTPHAFAKVKVWSKRKGEFQKRAAFALLASLAQHDKKAPDEPFLACLPLIEECADDDRNFVMKGVNWALRGIGERSKALHLAAMTLAKQLAKSDGKAQRWVGKDAVRQLQKPAILARIKRGSAKKSAAKK
ncbi:MAG: 3-methyladenine DNA glycosylase AlkD [Planctomycetota bacterium]|jgi:3-methyladenine DNA glycosylase AlkD